MPSPFHTAFMMSSPPMPPGRSEAKYRSPLLRMCGKYSSEEEFTPAPMFSAAPHSSEDSLNFMYHKSRPPCPPGMSLTNTRYMSSGLMVGWPT